MKITPEVIARAEQNTKSQNTKLNRHHKKKSPKSRLSIQLTKSDLEKIDELVDYCELDTRSELIKMLINNYIRNHRLVCEIGYVGERGGRQW